MIYLILVISFLLDNLISFFLNTNLLFNPLLSLVSLIIIFRYYHRKDENKYLITSFVLGLVYDIVCTDTVFLNAGIYLLLSLFIIKFYKIFSYNLLNSAILLIIIYRSITFLVLSNFNFISFNLYHLLQSISSSLILNLLYLSFFFLKKKKYKRYLQA